MKEDFPEYSFSAEPNLEDWGHDKRAKGLYEVTGDFVGWFNDDDSYALDYVEKMMAQTAFADVVYCGWNVFPRCDFRLGNSTSGNFIVRTELARKAGYRSREYPADGYFISDIAQKGPVIHFLDEVLYFHNQQNATANAP